jgi:hypothetical protein
VWGWRYHPRLHITCNLLTDVLGKNGGLGHVEVKPGILLADVLEIRNSRTWSAHAHLEFDVPIVIISKRPDLWVLCKLTGP